MLKKGYALYLKSISQGGTGRSLVIELVLELDQLRVLLLLKLLDLESVAVCLFLPDVACSLHACAGSNGHFWSNLGIIVVVAGMHVVRHDPD